jgi:hypothetical protein
MQCLVSLPVLLDHLPGQLPDRLVVLEVILR